MFDNFVIGVRIGSRKTGRANNRSTKREHGYRVLYSTLTNRLTISLSGIWSQHRRNYFRVHRSPIAEMYSPGTVSTCCPIIENILASYTASIMPINQARTISQDDVRIPYLNINAIPACRNWSWPAWWCRCAHFFFTLLNRTAGRRLRPLNHSRRSRFPSLS